MAKPSKLPSGIVLRGETYRVTVMVGGKRVSSTCPTLEAALEVHKSMKAGLYKSIGISEGAYKTWIVQEAWDAYESYRLGISRRDDPKQFAWYGRVLVGHFGATTSLDDITIIKQNELFDELTINRKYSASVVNYLGTLLQQMQLYAWKRGRKAAMPVRMEGRKTTKGRTRFLSDQEEAQCIEWFTNTAREVYRELFVFYLDTGFRKTEAFKLKWEDIDLKSGRVTVWINKTNQPRTVKMTKRVKVILADLYISKRLSQPRVFDHISERKFYRVFDEMRDYIGCGDEKQFVIHMLRHTCATRLVGAGVDLRSVMQWMGHANIEMTQRYSHFIPSKLDSAANALDTLTDNKAKPKESNVISIA